MHIHHDHVGGHCHNHDHHHDHDCGHHHDHDHHCEHHHDHDHECGHQCGGGCACQHTPMEELVALMKYMVGHNAAHARELAELAAKLQQAGGSPVAYEQVMAAVSDFEKGNLRLSAVLASLDAK